MAIEVTPDGGINVSGKDDVMRYRRLAIVHGLTLEIMTGLKVSARQPSPLHAAKHDGLTAKNTKKGALRDVVAYMVANDGYEPTARVTEAMGK